MTLLGKLINYYIATGEKSNYYTLRAKQQRYGSQGYRYEVDVHVRNLSTNRDKAAKKAREFVGRPVPIDPDLETYPFDNAPAQAIDYSILRFGKYQGRDIAEIALEDPDYLVFVVDQGYVPTKAQGNIEHIKMFVGTQLEQLEQERQQAQARQQQRASRLVDAFGKDWLELQVTYGGNFAQDVCSSILQGCEPTERAIDILMEIRAKEAGRRGSKAYQAAFETLEQALQGSVA